jgi:hypothetical protein
MNGLHLKNKDKLMTATNLREEKKRKGFFSDQRNILNIHSKRNLYQ